MTPSERYRADLAGDGFYHDAVQQRAIDKLQSLYDQLIYPAADTTLWSKLFSGKIPPLRGLYLWGGPGRPL